VYIFFFVPSKGLWFSVWQIFSPFWLNLLSSIHGLGCQIQFEILYVCYIFLFLENTCNGFCTLPSSTNSYMSGISGQLTLVMFRIVPYVLILWV
jgi:hypothetical protein